VKIASQRQKILATAFNFEIPTQQFLCFFIDFHATDSNEKDFYLFSVLADTVYPAYIELFLTNANFIGRIRRYEQGTVYERMAVSPEDFLSYETRMPTYEEQVKFADKIQRIQDKIELETSFLNYLQKQRKYFLNAMFI